MYLYVYEWSQMFYKQGYSINDKIALFYMYDSREYVARIMKTYFKDVIKNWFDLKMSDKGQWENA